MLERAATALAMNRLIDRDRESLERQRHHSLLVDILNWSRGSREEIESRSQNLGVPTSDRLLVGCVVKVPETPDDRDTLRREARRRDKLDLVAAASQDAKVASLVGVMPSGSFGILASLPNKPGSQTQLGRLANAIHAAFSGRIRPRGVIIGVGSVVSELGDVRRSFQEAEQVAEAVVGEEHDLKAYYELPDIRIRGLLHLLQNDSRVHSFVDRELAPLLNYDNRHGSDLTRVLSAYLASGRNISVAAKDLRMSRPAFYKRLQLTERVLGVDLSVESCLSLHVALLGAGLVTR